VVYMKNGGTTDLDVGTVPVNLEIKWFNPRKGGALQNGTKTNISGTGKLNIGEPPTEKTDDWTALVGVNNITAITREGKTSTQNKFGFSYELSSKRFLTGILNVGTTARSARVSMFNLQGNQLKSEIADEVNNGQIKFNWNLTDAKSGMYFVLINAGGFSQLEKIIVR
jgi:Secretion system C-terminal sorting domain/Putative collagen-binding domain of a collagenase